MSYWREKRAVITGGSSGLGRVLAEVLIEQGARLLLVARDPQALDETAEVLRGRGGEVHTLTADVTVQDDVTRLAATVDSQLGGVDVVCHCAGRSMRGEILAAAADDHRALWEVNFLATAEVTRALAGQLEASRGHVVLVGSLASKVAPRYLGAYPASKFPLVAFAQQLRLTWGHTGPHVLLVCPGPIARQDAATRYGDQAGDLPAEAAAPGGGAKVRAIDPRQLSLAILRACERRQTELIVPGKARLLFVVSQLSTRLGDWLLGRSTAR